MMLWERSLRPGLLESALAGVVLEEISYILVTRIFIGTYLGEATCLEERSDADKAILVVPHDMTNTLLGVIRDDEDVLEDWKFG